MNHRSVLRIFTMSGVVEYKSIRSFTCKKCYHFQVDFFGNEEWECGICGNLNNRRANAQRKKYPASERKQAGDSRSQKERRVRTVNPRSDQRDRRQSARRVGRALYRKSGSRVVGETPRVFRSKLNGRSRSSLN